MQEKGGSLESHAATLAKCSALLMKNNPGSEHEDLKSTRVQVQEARTLQCLPGLLNAPGFMGTIVEEKDRMDSTEIVVDQQCITPPVCGRLAAILLSAWQSRRIGGVGGLHSQWHVDEPHMAHDDCTARVSENEYVCYDYSHKCFKAALQYLCQAVPACCPAARSCRGLTQEAFIRDPSRCNTCFEPPSLVPFVHGGSFENFIRQAVIGSNPLGDAADLLGLSN